MEIENKHSSRPVGGAETGSQGGEDLCCRGRTKTGRVWRQAVWPLADPAAPHSHTDKLDKRRGAKQTTQPRALARGNKASNLWWKTPVGVGVTAGETPSLTGEVLGETHRGLGHAQVHPLGNQHQRGPVWLWVAEWKIEIRWRGERAPLLPLGPSPLYSIPAQRPPQGTPRAPPL